LAAFHILQHKEADDAVKKASHKNAVEGQNIRPVNKILSHTGRHTAAVFIENRNNGRQCENADGQKYPGNIGKKSEGHIKRQQKGIGNKAFQFDKLMIEEPGNQEQKKRQQRKARHFYNVFVIDQPQPEFGKHKSPLFLFSSFSFHQLNCLTGSLYINSPELGLKGAKKPTELSPSV